MNKPRIATYVLGNGPVAFSLMAACAISIYLWWIGRMAGELAVVSVVFGAWASRAHEELSRYRQWCAQWDSYGPGGEGSGNAVRRAFPAERLIVIGALIVWGYLLTTVKPNQPSTALGVLTLALMGYGLVRIVVAIVGAWRRRGQRRAATRQPDYILVAVCAPTVPTPSLHDAYRQLPDYCYRVFQ